MIKEITIGLGGLGTVGVAGGGSAYAAGAFDAYLYQGKPVEFRFKNKDSSEPITLRCEPLRSDTYTWASGIMTSETTAEIECFNLVIYDSREQLKIHERKEESQIPLKEGLACNVNPQNEVTCSINNQEGSVTYKKKEQTYEGSTSAKVTIKLSWSN
ncbi:hypothetical protein MHLP_01475 [Candidatus Mycoplasma haematolamae str. Purdue]|uniref:Uncharacterized protein n=1 Tax=Mycoplasma haematolamae (strain Purdue) TaxID=1212765 RepID=I7B9B9_MYCHA|nr:hypothetical protein [Candidatus Mycoplasma haematolamae]AFO51875.1 hypothetical protein MHLP_01475 [Candidatus Mycoplasma haematolamae str. Purdue]